MLINQIIEEELHGFVHARYVRLAVESGQTVEDGLIYLHHVNQLTFQVLMAFGKGIDCIAIANSSDTITNLITKADVQIYSFIILTFADCAIFGKAN